MARASPGKGALTRRDCDFLVTLVATTPQLAFEPAPVTRITEDRAGKD
jgi:hypothetical protein